MHNDRAIILTLDMNMWCCTGISMKYFYCLLFFVLLVDGVAGQDKCAVGLV